MAPHSLAFLFNSLISEFKCSNFSKLCLNNGISKNSFLVSLYSTRFLWVIYFYGFNYYLFSDDFQLFISSPTLSLKLQTCVSNCLWESSTWMSYRHLKHNMFKNEFNIFSLSQYLLSYSLPQLPVWLSNPLPKLGIIFVSSYSLMTQIRSTDLFLHRACIFLLLFYACCLCPGLGKLLSSLT